MLEAAPRRRFAIAFRHISRRYPGVLMTLLALILLPVPFASAIDVPESAYSTSLGMDPMLLVDHEVLAFLQPSMALLHTPQAVAVVSGSEPDLIGVLVGRGDTRVSVASRGRGLGSSFPFNLYVRIVQAGLARKIGSSRFACAVHFDMDPDGTRTTTSDQSRDYEKRESGMVAGQASVGVGSGSRRMDVSITYHDLRSAYRQEVSTPPDETKQEHLASPIQLTAISSTPISGAGNLVLALDWTGGHSEVTELLDGIERGAETYSRVSRIHGAWQSPSLSPSTLYTIHSSWESAEYPWVYLSVDGREVRRESTRTLQLGLSIRHRVSSHFNALGGVSTSHLNGRSDRHVTFWNAPTTRRTVIRDGYTLDRFSWGLQFERGRTKLVGGLSTTLDLENLISRVDVRVNL